MQCTIRNGIGTFQLYINQFIVYKTALSLLYAEIKMNSFDKIQSMFSNLYYFGKSVGDKRKQYRF